MIVYLKLLRNQAGFSAPLSDDSSYLVDTYPLLFGLLCDVSRVHGRIVFDCKIMHKNVQDRTRELLAVKTIDLNDKVFVNVIS